MTNHIERYIHAVTRRLPEKEREEVRKELTANIYDMLPDDPTEAQIESVLYDLGNPADLAAKYRQKPQYLISPAVYSEYVSALKLILPIVAVALAIAGGVLSVMDVLGSPENISAAGFVQAVLGKSISMAVSGVVQTLVWITVGFAIADRVNHQTKGGRKNWKLEDLPDIDVTDKKSIPLSDLIVELIVVPVFALVAVLMFTGHLPILVTLSGNNMEVVELFSSAFRTACIPAVLICAAVSLMECLVKLKVRRWTPLVCGTVILGDVVNLVVFLRLVRTPEMFSNEFTSFLSKQSLGDFDLLRLAGKSPENPVLLIITIAVVTITLVECIQAVYNTFRNKSIG